MHYKTIGVCLVILAMIHVIFPKYFNWDEELKTLSLVNRQMIQVHTFFIALTLFLMGVLCFVSAHDLVQTNLGKIISLGLAIFWGVRLFIQFFGYSAKLWKGKKFETFVHVLFSFFWTYLTVVFTCASIS